MTTPPQIVRRVLAGLIAGVLLVGAGYATTAHADSDDDSITRYSVVADAQPDGSLQVQLEFDFDFGDDTGHGPLVALNERQEVADDDDRWRSTPIDDDSIEVSSPSNAPTTVERERDGGTLVLQIGDEDVDLEGTQTYRIAYTIRGVANPADLTGSELDELNWNPIGTGWEIPISNVGVDVGLPVPVERTACFSGEEYDRPCDVTAADDRLIAGVDRLEPHEGLQVVAGVPAGTFTGRPTFTQRYTAGNVLGFDNAASPLAGGLVAALGVAGAVFVLRRRGRDASYAGVTPGQLPAAGRPGDERVGGATGATAVRFTPPDQGTPGQIGVLTDATSDSRDVTATLIDLAVRGHLVIEETTDDDAGDKKGWMLHRKPDTPGTLQRSEQRLLDQVFSSGPDVALTSLAGGTMAKAVAACHADLYTEVTDDLGWFRAKPSTVKASWGFVGIGMVILGIAATIALGVMFGLGLIGVGVAVVGVAVTIMSAWAPARTATGSAILSQAEGFKQYLATAEAGQLRFEEGVDIFSRYLPYAIIWKLTDRWAKVFADLEARGHDLPVPAWYVGANVYAFSGSGTSFASSIEGFTSAATTSMTSATSGSGGGSGFSGGGGVGGGGGGGW